MAPDSPAAQGTLSSGPNDNGSSRDDKAPDGEALRQAALRRDAVGEKTADQSKVEESRVDASNVVGASVRGPEVSGESAAEVTEDSQVAPSGTLLEAVTRLGLEIAPDRLAKLDAYCRALWSLNEQINLTRHTTYDLFARRDLLDTYHLANYVAQGEEVLDVGTGGGVPGIPLSILRPDLKVSLCDSVGKKARAVEQLVHELKLPVYVYATRVQDVLEEQTFDTLVTRAAGSITQLCNWLNPHWHCFNRLLAIKGPKWVEERADARHRGVLHGIRLRRIHGYNMPGTKSESVVLQMERPRPGQVPDQQLKNASDDSQ